MSSSEGSTAGILGGTFDPVHIGHLIIAEEIRSKCNLQKILFIPSAHPPHKAIREVTPARLRWEMVCLAIQDNPGFQASAVEIEREGPSYTVDTLTQLRDLWGQKVQIYLIIGADEAIDVSTWKEPDRVFALCTVLVASRPRFDLQAIDPGWRKKMKLVTVPQIEISSTAIRGRVEEGKEIRYLVPKPVEKFIQEKKLYLDK